MKYRVGWPFWKHYAKLGGTICIRILVEYDEEANVFIASSPDLKGLFCEGSKIPELKKSVEACANALLEEELKEDHAPLTSIAFSLS